MAAAPAGDDPRPVLPRRELTTPRSAAIAGILFAVLLGTSLVLLRLSVPDRAEDAGQWLSDPTRRRTVRWALNLVPFAGIAFLWFIGVVRDRIGAFEDRFFSTVFLGSGLLFLCSRWSAATSRCCCCSPPGCCWSARTSCSRPAERAGDGRGMTRR